MKTFKNIAIIAGIIVAILSLQAHGAPSKSKKELKAEAAKLYELEQQLIEDYLETQRETEVVEERIVRVFDENDNVVYEGSEDSEEAQSLLRKADFLMQYGSESFYRIENQ